MATTKLTETAVKRLRPRDKRYERLDGLGLLIEVYPTGAKVWRHAYAIRGRRHKITLGSYPEMSLSDARRRHAEQRAQIRDGVNPSEKSPVEDGGRSVADFFDDYWNKAPHKGRRALAERQRMIAKDVLPRVGAKDISKVTRRDLLLVLETIAERAPVVANRVGEILRSAFAWAELRGEIEKSPAAGLPDMTVERPRDRVVSIEDLAHLWRQLTGEVQRGKHAKPLSAAVTGAFRLILLTGCRTSEAREADWREMGEEGVWTIPEGRSKTGEPHRVLLSAPARRLLDEIRAEGSAKGLVFPSPRSGRALGEKSLIQALRRLNDGAFTVHDIRRSVATHLGELGIEPHIVERCLGHAVFGMRKVYNRSKYDAAAKRAWELWGERFMAVLERKDGDLGPAGGLANAEG